MASLRALRIRTSPTASDDAPSASPPATVASMAATASTVWPTAAVPSAVGTCVRLGRRLGVVPPSANACIDDTKATCEKRVARNGADVRRG